jgi:DNA modification methylase
MLKDLPDESIDLCYIDPPFNSNRNYETFWGDVQEKRAFDDRFGDADAYIHYMRPRVLELYRVLKKTGSFYYHCDWHASHYVKVELDKIFGFNFFQNEIIWQRTNAHNDARKKMPNLSDSIFYYTKTNDYVYNPLFLELDKGYVEKFYRNKDEMGNYMSGDLTGPKTSKGESGREWKGYNPTNAGRSWAVPNIIVEELVGEEKCKNMGVIEKLDLLFEKGYIIFTKNGTPRVKRYIDKSRGTVLGNIWTDIKPIQSQAKERLGYPTQKPLALMERIINASSNKGDVVLDAFCGCGTTLVAAEKLNRKWIGIDISPTACRVMSQRLYELYKLREGKDFWVDDLPKTEEELRALPHFEFQNWAVIALGQLTNTTGIPNKIKSGDFGIDGRLYPIDIEKKKTHGEDLFGDTDKYLPVQVKQMDKVGRPDIDNFYAAIKRDGRNKGYFVSFAFSKDAEAEVKRLWKEGEVDINLIEVNSLLKAEQYRK